VKKKSDDIVRLEAEVNRKKEELSVTQQDRQAFITSAAYLSHT
jgi:hypothetical protein